MFDLIMSLLEWLKQWILLHQREMDAIRVVAQLVGTAWYFLSVTFLTRRALARLDRILNASEQATRVIQQLERRQRALRTRTSARPRLAASRSIRSQRRRRR